MPIKALNSRQEASRNSEHLSLEKEAPYRRFQVKVAFSGERVIMSAERLTAMIKVAILDNSLDPDVYKPVLHWSRWLTEKWTAFRAPEGQFPRLTDGYTHLILTGSEASILAREGWVDREVDLVRDALDRMVPILGSCYGHQLLALAIGGPAYVRRCEEPEIGWIPLRILEDTPLLGAAGTAYAFTLHFDEVVDPGGRFKVLAETPGCRINAFQYGERPVWGIQSHPEIGVEDGRNLLEAEFERSFKGVEMLAQALRSVPRDTKLIRFIVPAFLNA
jgi:GMP synthase-like glutamine amidotransferase